MKANCRSRPVDADTAIVFAHLLLVPRYERWLMGCTSSVLEGGDEAAEGSRYRLAFGIGSFTDGESLVLREVDRTGHRLRLVKERAGPPLTIQVDTDGTGASCRLVVELEHS